MKSISTLIFLLAAFSCTHQTIDEKIEQNLKKSWDEYFQESFVGTKQIDVFVVTNRQAKSDVFGCEDNKFGVDLGQKTWLGSCKINVPKNHEVGEILSMKESNQSLDNFFKVISADALSEQEIVKTLKKSQRTPLVFIHGFNVTYEEAVLRAAQIAYDLKYQGPVVVFTWPAGANEGVFENALINKTYDNNFYNAQNSIEALKIFLLNLEKNKIKINLLVHSMGHQIALPALDEIAKEKIAKKNPPQIFINKLILNAPDFEVDEFKKIAQNIKAITNRITLYCSGNDKAMMASRVFNKNNRLGSCAYLPEIDTVDVSLIDDSVLGLGHGYYSSRPILSDVSQTLLGIELQHRLFATRNKTISKEKYFLRK